MLQMKISYKFKIGSVIRLRFLEFLCCYSCLAPKSLMEKFSTHMDNLVENSIPAGSL